MDSYYAEKICDYHGVFTPDAFFVDSTRNKYRTEEASLDTEPEIGFIMAANQLPTAGIAGWPAAQSAHGHR